MACSSAVERLTVDQVVAGSIPAGPVPWHIRGQGVAPELVAWGNVHGPSTPLKPISGRRMMLKQRGHWKLGRVVEGAALEMLLGGLPLREFKSLSFRQGDWRRGSATVRHTVGHWFDPSITHALRGLPCSTREFESLRIHYTGPLWNRPGRGI